MACKRFGLHSLAEKFAKLFKHSKSWYKDSLIILVTMGLSCNKMLDSSKPPTLVDRTESWSKIGGYVFRPVFRNELNEAIYERSQIAYNIAWRKHLNTMNRKQSFQEVLLINTEFYSKFKDCFRR